MTDGKRRRRRGRRGGQGRSAEDQQQPQGGPPRPGRPAPEESAADAEFEQTRPVRRDTRRGRAGAQASPNGGGIRRAPSASEPPPRRQDRRDSTGVRGRRDSSRLPEPPPPPDPLSVELGQAFRDAQEAVRDARKMLDKRKTEFGDEPDWMLDQLHAAEQRFQDAADRWVEHLSKTGRKMARR